MSSVNLLSNSAERVFVKEGSEVLGKGLLGRMWKIFKAPMVDSFEAAGEHQAAYVKKKSNFIFRFFTSLADAWSISSKKVEKLTKKTAADWGAKIQEAAQAAGNAVKNIGTKIVDKPVKQISTDAEYKFLASITDKKELQDALTAMFNGRTAEEAMENRFKGANKATVKNVLEKLTDSTNGAAIIHSKANMSAAEKAKQAADFVVFNPTADTNYLDDAGKIANLKEKFNNAYTHLEAYREPINHEIANQQLANAPLDDIIDLTTTTGAKVSGPGAEAIAARATHIQNQLNTARPQTLKDALVAAFTDASGTVTLPKTKGDVSKKVEAILEKVSKANGSDHAVTSGEKQLLDALGINLDGTIK